jgi:mRNA interferase MazF
MSNQPARPLRQVDRFDVYMVNLDPTVGSEMQKTRPGLVISPDEMNHRIATVIIAPMTTGGKLYPTRVQCRFDGKDAKIVLDQIRTVDKSRLARKMGRIDAAAQAEVLRVLAELFAP